MDMEITVKQADKVTLVITCGFIDGKTAPAFQTKMLEVLCEADIVLLDLSQVSFMSSAGLRAMLVTHQQTQQGQSKTVALAALPDGIRDNMEATGFLPFFQVFDTVEAGFQGLG
ncbi:anti-sigma factor antagonist [Desulfobulbus sp. F5]|nr:anti-sigma factor antagonist [Desulfobulbus sp. F5]